MKTPLILLAVIATLSPTAQAQSTLGTTAPVTVALTVTYSAPALQAKDPEGRVIPIADGGGFIGENNFTVDTTNSNGDVIKSVVTREVLMKTGSFKIGNKEILAVLADPEAPVLPPIGSAANPSPLGWTLMRVQDGDGIVKFIARHTSKVWVEIPDFGFGLDDTTLPPTHSENTKDVETTVTNPTTGVSPPPTRTLVSSGTSKGLGQGNVLGIGLLGVFNGGWKAQIRLIRVDNGDGTFSNEPLVIYVPQLLELKNAIGSDGDPELPGVVEGTVSSAVGIIQDLDLYLPAAP